MSVFRDDILAGKVAFVTGGGSGICKGITHAFLAHGAKAAIVGRKADRLEAAAKELSEATASECIATPADVRDPKLVEEALEATLDRFGRIDIIVNGAAQQGLDVLMAQLAPGGRMVFLRPHAAGAGRAFLLRKDGDAISERALFEAAGKLIPEFAAAPAFVF